MTEPVPELSPAAHGLLARVRSWFEQDVEPELAALRADAGRFHEVLPHLATLADLAVTLARADPGIPPQVLADAVDAAEVVARIAGELAAAGM